jgi:hypothetical protein
VQPNASRKLFLMIVGSAFVLTLLVLAGWAAVHNVAPGLLGAGAALSGF